MGRAGGENQRSKVPDRRRACPVCGEPVEPNRGEYEPFCSKRCRMADLGNWLSESYRISRPLEQADLDEED